MQKQLHSCQELFWVCWYQCPCLLNFGRLLLLEKVYPWKLNCWAGNLASNSLGTVVIEQFILFKIMIFVLYLQEGSCFASKRGILKQWI